MDIKFVLYLIRHIPNFGSRQLKTADSARLFDIKTKRRLCKHPKGSGFQPHELINLLEVLLYFFTDLENCAM